MVIAASIAVTTSSESSSLSCFNTLYRC